MKHPLIAPEEIERYSHSDAKVYTFLAGIVVLLVVIAWVFSTVAHCVDFQNVYMDVIGN